MGRARLDRLSLTALVCVVTLALPPGFMMPAAGIAASAQSTAAPKPAPAAPKAPAMPEHDGGWPRTFPVAGGDSATLYQPQIESWQNQKHMTAWAAVAYQRPDVKDPVFGTAKIEADTQVSPSERLVSFSDFAITEFNFPTLSREQSQALVAALRTGIPVGDRVIALDRVLAAIDKSHIRPDDAADIKADPPHVFFSTRPAILVNLDGDPVWSPIQGLDLEYAVNTNWDLFRTSSKVLYLRNNNTWLTAPDINGKRSPVGRLPASFTKLPASDNWKEAKANIPGVAVAPGGMPTVFVSTSPAELLLLRGVPTYQQVTGTSLLWVSNTESDLFRQGKTGAFYYLVTGRWFSAPSLDGPWTFATPNLPADFKQIPPDNPRSRVLASVPGTDQAIEAVLLAEMPQTARVSLKELKPPDVVYQGEPHFEPIGGTTLLRAVNTDNDVIKVGDLYYMCFQAVWFMSRSAMGPWQVATSVPPDIYRIPPSSPAYHVTYVTVEDSDPADDWVDFAYTAGYLGMAVAWGTAVWGSGWYYPPYVAYRGLYPAYFGYARTYGSSAWYNPWTGRYGRGFAAYGPFGGAGAGAVYNPRTGTYARGAAAYGPYGGRAVAQGWNPRTGTYAATRQGGNIDGNWGSSYVQRGDEWARTSHRTNYLTGATTRTVRGDDAGAATRVGTTGRTSVARGPGGDVYAGHNGNVYRRSGNGSWQNWNNGGWSAAERNQRDWSSVSNQLNSDRSARVQGAQRTKDWGSFQRSPSMSRAGSFRGGGGFGGGGFRGGGRR